MTTQPAGPPQPTGRSAAWIDRVRDPLPRGRTLPETAWRRRHRWLLGLLWLHVPVILVYGLAADVSLGHALGETALVAALAAAAASFFG